MHLTPTPQRIVIVATSPYSDTASLITYNGCPVILLDGQMPEHEQSAHVARLSAIWREIEARNAQSEQLAAD